jgi:hypothetical protein
LLPDIRRIGAESIERHVVLEEIFAPYGMLETALRVITAKLLKPRPPLCNLFRHLAVFGELREEGNRSKVSRSRSISARRTSSTRKGTSARLMTRKTAFLSIGYMAGLKSSRQGC